MVWVKMSQTAHGNADNSFHGPAATSLQGNLDTAYEGSNTNLECYHFVSTAGAFHAVVGPVATANTYEWGVEIPPVPILARTQKGATWRDVKIEWNVRGSGATDTFLIKTYLLPDATQPALDATGGILGETAVGTSGNITGTSWQDSSVTISPSRCGVLTGDGSVTGVSIPALFIHVAITADGDTDAIYIRGPRIEESF